MFFVKDEFAERWWSEDGDLMQKGAGELFTPIKTLLATRNARARAAHSSQIFERDFTWRPHYEIVGGGKLKSPYHVHHVVLDGTKTFLPLGWRLSRQVMQNIESNGDAFAKLTFDLVQLELSAKDTTARIKEAAPR
jgi:hypothetical protein